MLRKKILFFFIKKFAQEKKFFFLKKSFCKKFFFIFIKKKFCEKKIYFFIKKSLRNFLWCIFIMMMMHCIIMMHAYMYIDISISLYRSISIDLGLILYGIWGPSKHVQTKRFFSLLLLVRNFELFFSLDFVRNLRTAYRYISI